MKRKAIVQQLPKKRPFRRKSMYTKRRRRITPSMPWILMAQKAGRRYAVDHPLPEEEQPIRYINFLWYYFYLGEGRRIPDALYERCSEAYLAGYCAQAGIDKPDGVLVPTLKSLSAVVTVFNEGSTIASVLEQLQRLPMKEIIIVVNGSTDNSFSISRQCPLATVVHYPDSVGHDVGRSIGARLVTADMVLFIDGDIPVKAVQLAPFIRAIDRGADVALNDMTPFIGQFAYRDSVTMMKQFLNAIQGRPDLKTNSMTAIPHMLSRKAIEQIGAANLAVPPKAQSLAIQLELKICAPASIDVISSNKVTKLNTGASNPVSSLILGDHLEAMHMLLSSYSSRLQYKDAIRKRSALGEGFH
ncbi:glycosyltransferase family 2 protein [Paenibacillus aceris]|uniref:Glycosyltransferase 2-like domain-containing protein n=1 Tax=Paenibacillus aceris TaxID=869555 RepID=A0ABS4I817_9BACL|nr:glycosyltransferase family A protein [Paenibacillus aceris]MBP1966983.1 hypothetical protein [Paenibacillus aceris]